MKTTKTTSFAKRNQARKVAAKLLDSLPTAFTDTHLKLEVPTFTLASPMASVNKKRKNRHQNHRAFACKGFVYNGACPAGYA